MTSERFQKERYTIYMINELKYKYINDKFSQ